MTTGGMPSIASSWVYLLSCVPPGTVCLMSVMVYYATAANATTTTTTEPSINVGFVGGLGTMANVLFVQEPLPVPSERCATELPAPAMILMELS